MPTEYATNDEAQALVTSLMNDTRLSEFSGIRNHGLKIGVLMKHKMDSADQLVETGKPSEVKKVPIQCMHFMEPQWIVIFDAAVWDQSDAIRKTALAHKALMGIEVTGEGRSRQRKPDIVEYNATVVRYGAYTPVLTSLQEAFQLAGRRVAQSVAQSGDVSDSPPIEVSVRRERRPRRARQTNTVPDEEET